MTYYSRGVRFNKGRARLYKPIVFKRRRYRPGAGRAAAFRAARMRRFSRNPALRNLRTGGLLGIETKYLDIPILNVALTAPNNAVGGEMQPTSIVTGCLSAPAQGDGAQNRDGKKIVVKSILIQGTISCVLQGGQAAADTVPECYLALVQDSQTNGVTINSEDVFANVVASSTAATAPFRNMSNVSRFKVLKTWRRRLLMPTITGSATTGDIAESGQHTNVTMSWKGLMPVNFAASSITADVANVVDNSIHLIGYCSNVSLVPTFSGSARIRFVG